MSRMNMDAEPRSQERRASSSGALVVVHGCQFSEVTRTRGHLHLQSIYIPRSGLVGNAGLDVKGGGVGITV